MILSILLRGKKSPQNCYCMWLLFDWLGSFQCIWFLDLSKLSQPSFEKVYDVAAILIAMHRKYILLDKSFQTVAYNKDPNLNIYILGEIKVAKRWTIYFCTFWHLQIWKIFTMLHISLISQNTICRHPPHLLMLSHILWFKIDMLLSCTKKSYANERSAINKFLFITFSTNQTT